LGGFVRKPPGNHPTDCSGSFRSLPGMPSVPSGCSHRTANQNRRPATGSQQQQQRQRGWKLYSFHAPEVECVGKGKASAPYEFGVKASVVTTNARAPGGQFVLHARTGHLGRCYLKGRAGDAANVILSAVVYNLRLVRVILLALLQTFTIRPALKLAS